jgi:Ca2+-transporting ATPase
MGAFTNLMLLAIILVSVSLQIGIHHIPGTKALFRIGALSADDIALCLVIGLVPVSVVELMKLVRRFEREASGARA